MAKTISNSPAAMHLSNDAATLAQLMSKRAGLSAQRVVEIALKEKAERDGALDELEDLEDEKDALLRLVDSSEPNVPWSQIKSGVEK